MIQSFDRVDYFNRIRAAAGDSVDWVTVDDRGSEVIMLISGCDTACALTSIDPKVYHKIVSIRDDKWDPQEVFEALLK